jgi:multiple sugar transport system substrate-binding protein
MFMISKITALAAVLMTTAFPALADFWSDAGAKYQGVVLHGVTESAPPSMYIKEVLAPAFEKATGIKVEIETTSWDQMYDKAIKDMEAGTGIYDMVYIEQDIIYAYLQRKFLTDITQTLKDKPELKAPTYDDANFTLLQGKRRPLRRADGSLPEALSLSQGSFRGSRDPSRLQGQDRQGPRPGDDA